MCSVAVAHDQPGAVEVIVINETMAASYWPGQDPIGKRIQIYDTIFATFS